MTADTWTPWADRPQDRGGEGAAADIAVTDPPEVDDAGRSFTVNGMRLRDALLTAQTVMCDNTGSFFHVVQLREDPERPGHLLVAATNGNRTSLERVNATGRVFPTLIPARHVVEILEALDVAKMVNGGGLDVEFTDDNGTVRVSVTPRYRRENVERLEFAPSTFPGYPDLVELVAPHRGGKMTQVTLDLDLVRDVAAALRPRASELHVVHLTPFLAVFICGPATIAIQPLWSCNEPEPENCCP